MIRLISCVVATSIFAFTFAQAQEQTRTQPSVTSISTMNWKQPDSWIRPVAGDEKDFGSTRILDVELAPPARVPLSDGAETTVPEIPIQPVPDYGLPNRAEGKPNSNLPPQEDVGDPDYSEVRKQEAAQFEASPPEISAPDTIDSQPHIIPQQIPQPVPLTFQNGLIANGYWFDSGDGCGESCGQPVFNHRATRQCCNSCFRCLSDEGCSVFTVYTGVAFLHRHAPKNQRLAFNPSNASQNLDAGDFDFGTQSGIEVGATAHRLFGELDLDLRFLSVGNFSDRQNLQTTGGVTRIDMAFPANLTGPRNILANYESDLSSFEAGLRFRMGAANDWTTFWLGLRVLDIGETLSGSFVSPGAAQPTQNLSVDVSNRLFGLQIGMDETIISDCWHSVEGYWRAGIYGNDSSSSTSLIVQGTPPNSFRSQGSAAKTAFVGEVGVKAKLRLTNNLNFYGRYQMLLAEGVALAGEQPASTNLLSRTGHSSNGGLFYHGAVLGLEYVY